jgi:hypothetical protein
LLLRESPLDAPTALPGRECDRTGCEVCRRPGLAPVPPPSHSHTHTLGATYTHTHTLTPTPMHSQINNHPPSLTQLPSIIVSTADATTHGEAGCQIAVSEPFSSSGGEITLKNTSTFDAARGECASASNRRALSSEQCLVLAAETRKGNRPEEASVELTLAIQAETGAEYGVEPYIHY